MTVCEMCGKNGSLIQADVEGVALKVCSGCAKYGVVKKDVMKTRPSFLNSRKQKKEFALTDNFASLLRKEREKRDLSNKDFAAFLNERESTVAKWENGSLRPRVGIARAIGKKLGIRLIKEVGEETAKKERTAPSKKVPQEFTLGDFIKVRKRK